MHDPSFLEHLAAFFLMVVIPLQSFLSGKIFEDGDPLTSNEKFKIYLANSASQWILTVILLLIWWFSGKTLYDIGLRIPNLERANLIWILVGAFLFAYILDAWWQVRNKKARKQRNEEWSKYTPFLPTNLKEFSGFLIVVFTAAICEEILFRGFLIHYLLQFVDNDLHGYFLVVLLPSVIFASSHIYQGWEAVLKIALLATVFATILLLTGSLLIPIVLHFLVNLLSGLLGLVFWDPEAAKSSGMEDLPE
ncbi:MAG: CPBP family intramembrane glutamic endopeptidase [Saprospiraceae bacterium]